MAVYPTRADDEYEIEYPTSDGEPMGETDLHRDMMIDLIEALKAYYWETDDVYVSGNLLLFYEEGNTSAHLAPDVMVTTGISNERRQSYMLWKEGKAPDLVIEVTSRSSKIRDMGIKKGLYEVAGVQEYVLFDPLGEYLKPRFQVFRREGEFYVQCLIPEERGYASSLGLTFRVVDGILRVFETASETLLPTPSELATQLRQERAKTEAEREKAEAEREKAEAEREKAEAEREKAEAERARAERLAEKLRELGIDPREV